MCDPRAAGFGRGECSILHRSRAGAVDDPVQVYRNSGLRSSSRSANFRPIRSLRGAWRWNANDLAYADLLFTEIALRAYNRPDRHAVRWKPWLCRSGPSPALWRSASPSSSPSSDRSSHVSLAHQGTLGPAVEGDDEMASRRRADLVGVAGVLRGAVVFSVDPGDSFRRRICISVFAAGPVERAAIGAFDRRADLAEVDG